MDNGFCAIEVPFFVHLHGTLLAGCVASLHSDRLVSDPGGPQIQPARQTVRHGVGIPVRFALEQVSDLDWNQRPTCVGIPFQSMSDTHSKAPEKLSDLP